MSIVSGVIKYVTDNPRALEYLIDANRPYNMEKRRIRSLISFGVISSYMAKGCLKEFINTDHKEALKINKEMN